jgi:BASS family bile acid:Na+ symporter
MNQEFVLGIALPVTLFLIMFSMGTDLKPANFLLLLRSPRSVMIGLLAQMVLLPCLALALLYPLRLPLELYAGFVILALSPGGTTSNLFSYLAKGNLALSITLTAVVSLLTPVTLPLLAEQILASRFAPVGGLHLPFAETMLKLLVVTVLPVILGMLLNHYHHDYCRRNMAWITRAPLFMLLAVIAGIIHQNWQQMPVYLEQTGAPALLLASLALVAGYWFARFFALRHHDARTIAIETSIQNGGTAILVTGTLLQNPAMTVAPVMYGILMLLPVSLYLLWKNQIRPVFAG